jgi:tRNA(adenine34) deaminase
VTVPAGAAVPAGWEPVMRLALDQARLAPNTGDVPVGAVVLGPDGTLVAASRNEREATGDPTAHAEIVAIRAAVRVVGDGWRLVGCTLVVTLEPCPMCAGALVAARVGRLVFGAYDEKAGAVGSVWDVVRDRRVLARPDVVGGVLAAECGQLLERFFLGQRAR